LFNIGPQELLLILVVALVIVGPKRLPEISRTLGKGLREFRKAQDEVTKTISLGLKDTPAEPAPHTERGASTAATTAETSGAEGSQTPPGSEGPPSDSPTDMVRSLGRGLAEIRRAREEIQRTFRVDLSARPDASSHRPKQPPAPTPSAQAADEPSGIPSAPASETDDVGNPPSSA
jgi:TatA/E family protein of Tat protein translocase